MEEEKSNAQHLQEQVNSLNSKIRTYKREKEDNESEIEGLQHKLRQAKAALDEAEQDNSTLTAQLSKLRGSGASRSKKVL